MRITDLLSIEDVLRLNVGEKRELLSALAHHAETRFGVKGDNLFEALLQREALGSTGVGVGVALPHARIANLDRAYGVFATLSKPVEFGSVDDAPVDVVFLVVLPARVPDLHLKPLALVARRLRSPGVAAALRGLRDRKAIFALLAQG